MIIPLRQTLILLTLVSLVLSLSSCASIQDKSSPPVTAAHDGKQVLDEDDEYADITYIPDPFEPLNRGIFAFNHYLYKGIIRPVAKTYEFLIPSLLRKGIDNAYENVRFPIRLVNHSLQGKFDRAGLEFEKFLVNSTAGVGGLWKPSDKISALADIPESDTGQTFTKWGMKPGFYLVLPLLGPSSVRDGAGRLGDAGLNPVSWAAFIFGGPAWTIAISAPDSARGWPGQMDAYQTVTKEAIDPYLATRSSFIQYREGLKSR